jgi:SAM-dependent methyltransferase
MIFSATLSKPAKNISEYLDKNYIKIRINLLSPEENIKSSKKKYSVNFYTEKQVFQKYFSEEELNQFLENNIGKSFKNAIVKTENEEITYLTNKKGEIKKLTKKISESKTLNSITNINREKNYIIKENTIVPFLIELGVMTKEGKVHAAKYDKFKQINRFLEFIDDILDDVKSVCLQKDESFSQERPLRIADFGCGKSYLTFAVYYFLTELKNIPVEITGLDLKEDVIKNCQQLAKKLNCKNLNFYIGDVAKFSYKNSPDIMITLHACDTATDYALEYAIKNNTAAILSVPCCQHEINLQLNKENKTEESAFSSLKNWGIIKERFSALLTDTIRAELLEQENYKVQLLEFIDFSHTPKNILIRAVKRKSPSPDSCKKSKERLSSLLSELNKENEINQTLIKLLK